MDTVEPAIVPVLLGAGIPMLPSPVSRTKLSLSGHRVYPKSGIVFADFNGRLYLDGHSLCSVKK